ncbi:MAG: hypothetical protein R3D52_07010 [Xanthobacteraceae bacterium]
MNFRNAIVRFVLAVSFAVLLTSGLAHARVTPPTAKSFLASIYEAYLGNSAQSAKGIVLDDAEAIRRYFSPGLASLILDDNLAARRPGNAIVLGNDPFVGHESWDIKDLSVEVKETGAKAIGTISFTNFGKPEKVVVELLRVGSDWRIAEIKWGPLTLRSIYRRKWQAALEGSPAAK